MTLLIKFTGVLQNVPIPSSEVYAGAVFCDG